MSSTDWIQALKVAELKEELKKRDQPVAGKKAELAARLEEYIKQHEAGSAEEPAKAGEEDKETGGEQIAAPEAPEEETAAAVAEETKIAEPEAKEAVEPEVAAAPAEAQAEPAPADELDLDYGDSEDEQTEKEAAEKPVEKPAALPAEPSKKQEEKDTKKKPELESSRKRPTSDIPSSELAPRPEKQAKTEEQNRQEQKVTAPAAETAPAAATTAEKPEEKKERKPGSRALLIEGFVRPFTENQARTLLNQSGTVVAMWMPTIRNLAWVIYSTKAEAEAAKTALFKLQWPSGSPKVLMPRSVSIRAAEKAIGQGTGNADFKVERIEEDGPDEPEYDQNAVNIGTMTIPAAMPSSGGRGGHPSTSRHQDDDEILKDASPLRVKDLRELLSRRPGGPSLERNQRDSGPNLDELFKKTSAKPAIYWLPLSDEAVELKKKAKAAAAGAGGGSGGGAGAPGGGYTRM